MLTQIGRQACVFTFGYGPEHDTVLLPSLANAGNGLFYYIDNSDTIPESFCDCLGGLLSVAAQVRGGPPCSLMYSALESALIQPCQFGTALVSPGTAPGQSWDNP